MCGWYEGNLVLVDERSSILSSFYVLCNMQELVAEILEKLSALSSEDARKATEKFVPTSQHYIGVRMPDINLLAREYKHHGLDLVIYLWNSENFECRIMAAKIMERSPIGDSDKILMLVDTFKDDLSDWAVCDSLGMQAIKKPVSRIPDKTYARAVEYLTHSNFWVVRLGLVFLTHFAKDQTHRKEIEKLIKPLESHEEYYVRKGVVWVRRVLNR